jgi:hypothetical protein
MPQPPASVWSLPHVVYRAYDAADRLVYVGCTADWPGRLRNHVNATWWWTREIVRVELVVCGGRVSALAEEALVIRAEHPIRNVQHRELVA